MSQEQQQSIRSRLSGLLVGHPLETQALAHQTVSRRVGLAVFASDALSSTAYATEEILIILAIAGLSASVMNISIPIAIAISVLIGIVTISYRQTILAYPNGGGAYIVARDNLGEVPAQITGAALLTDYILTVAVSISAGVAQLVSAFPAMMEYRVYIALGLIFMIMMINLRGVKESGFVFAIPTYLFLGGMYLMLGVGFIRIFSGNLGTVSGVETIQVSAAPLTLFLILRAFSSGCTALTGIEAISNGVTAFKEPRSKNAAATLVWMSAILISLFIGITILAHQVLAVPSESETVISQISKVVFGEGSVLYLIMIGFTMLILIMAANTSFADFPRLSALMAGDRFLPRQFTNRGSRLVFSWGIVFLAAIAGVLVVITNARTTTLIPLYAIGVFLSFTVSQTGMVIHLRKIGRITPGEQVAGRESMLEYDRHWKAKMIISGIGAVTTAGVMLIFAVTKFRSGAWFVLILIPILVYIFFRIHRHYAEVADSLRTGVTLENVQPRQISTIVLVEDVHAGTVRLVNFARSLGNPWKAVHISVDPDRLEKVKLRWQQIIGEGELVVIPSPYRHLAAPLRDYVKSIIDAHPDHYVHIILGHLAMDTFMEQMLHQNSAYLLNVALQGLNRVVVTQIPYQISDVTTKRQLESQQREADTEVSAVAEGEEDGPVDEYPSEPSGADQ